MKVSAPENLLISLGRRIREIRHAKILTIQQLADLADVDPSFLGQIERGAGIPSLGTISGLSTALEVSARDLFDFSSSSTAGDFVVKEIHRLLQPYSPRRRMRALRILREIL